MTKKYTKNQKADMLQIYAFTYSSEDAIRKIKAELDINITITALKVLASKNGVKKQVTAYSKQSSLSLEKIQELIQDYESGLCSMKQLMNKYGYKTKKSIQDKVRAYGGTMRTPQEARRVHCTYDENMFKVIDSQWKGYFIGLLLTEGYTNSQRGYVGIDMVDKYTMQFLSKKTGKKMTLSRDGRNTNFQDRYRILFTSKKMLDDVKRFSIVDKKTRNLKPPNLKPTEEKYLPFIMKGIIDGDGWIRKDGREFFIVSASIDFINWCKEVLESFGMQNLRISTMTFKDNPNWNDAYLIRTAIQENIQILKDKIYCYDIGMKVKRSYLFPKSYKKLSAM